MTNVPHCSEEVAKKLVYEITMLRHTYNKLKKQDVSIGEIGPGSVMPLIGTSIEPEEVKEASPFVESFLLHARVLCEFFCRERSTKGVRPDDVLARDFLNSWPVPGQPDYPYLHDEKDRIHKTLAHLSTQRVIHDQTGKNWDLYTIKQELEPMIETFLAMLPDPMKPWFEIDEE